MTDSEPRVSEPQLAALRMAISKSNSLTEERIHLQYEIPGEDGDNILFYHNRAHTRGVVRRGVAIGQVVATVCPQEVSITDVETIRFAAGKHDEVQLSEPVEVTVKTEDGREWAMVKRQRATGENERLSAESLKKFADEEKIVSQGLLTDAQVAAAEKGILLTTPGWDDVHKTVVQPGFAESPFIAQAVALADLAGSGMEGAQTAVREAAALFLEEYMDVRRYNDEHALAGAERRAQRVTDMAQEGFYKGQLLDWLDRQVAFVRGRQKLVWREIDTLQISQEGRLAVRNLFSEQNFEDAVNAVIKLRNNLVGLSFTDCMKQLDAMLYDEQPNRE